MNALTIKKTGSHYTSSTLSTYMAKKLVHHYHSLTQNSKETLTVLDPSCGSGELLKAIAAELDNNSIHYIGIDTNITAISQANEYLTSIPNTQLFHLDYLELFKQEEQLDLFSVPQQQEIQDFLAYSQLEMIDLIIANPPYVRTQVMGTDQSQELGRRFNLKGRVDLYQVFLVAMTQHLKENGFICVITSNRYLTTAGGKDIRQFLNEHYEILEVIDLGDTKLFNAAVLPAIFIGRKRTKNEQLNNHAVPFTRIYEYTKKISDTDTITVAPSIFDILEVGDSGVFKVEDKYYQMTVGYLSVPEDAKELWVMASKEDKEWASKLKCNSKYTFNDVFKVRVGIKTTADVVFIRKEWASLPENQIPEDELIYRLISSENAARWTFNDDKIDLKILYTHKDRSGKKVAIDLNIYPRAANYLNTHRERLAGRTYIQKSKRQWFEIWVPQDPLAFSKPKVVFPDISPSSKFAIDLNGYMVDGNCYWLTLKNEDDLDLLYLATAVANSNIMNKYHEIEFQNVLYSGRKRYLTQYVKKYLLPDPHTIHSQNTIRLVKQIISNHSSSDEISKLEKQIEKEIALAFNID